MWKEEEQARYKDKPKLVFGDVHIPFQHPNFLDFLKATYKKYNCGQVICLGDLVDNHAISQHQKETCAKSPYDELDMALSVVKEYAQAFPEVYMAHGNHDMRPLRQAASVGLGGRFLKPLSELLELPDTWTLDDEFIIDDVLYKHGINCGGVNGAINAALKERMSTVIGHFHSLAGVKYSANKRDIIFGANVGCVDADTEFLTPNGWKKISEYEQGDLVCQYNEDGTAEFVEPNAYIKLPAEKLYKVKTKYGYTQIFSDDHTMVYEKNGQLRKCSGTDFMATHNEYANGFDGKFISGYEIDRSTSIPYTDEQIRVMVMVNADGTFPKTCVDNRCYITLRKKRKIERARQLLKDANIPFKEVEYKDNTTRFMFNAPTKSKSYSGFWWECSKHQLRIVASEVMHWDGDQSKVYCSKNKSDCDFIQYAFSSTGRRATISKDGRTNKVSYRVVASKNIHVGLASTSKPKIKTVVPRDGYKYCFNVPSHMLVLRCEDDIIITGNCGIDIQAYAFAYGKHDKDRPILGCAIVFNSGYAEFIPMPSEYFRD